MCVSCLSDSGGLVCNKIKGMDGTEREVEEVRRESEERKVRRTGAKKAGESVEAEGE